MIAIAPPAVVAVEDAASGCAYFWERLSGAVSWRAPRDFRAAGAGLPFLAARAGRREPLAGGGEKVTHVVTYEMVVKDGQRTGWYIVGL